MSLLWDGKGARIEILRLSKKQFRYRLYIECRKRPIELTTKQFYSLEKAFKLWIGYKGETWQNIE